jgi:SAM-dependent methyltransferase
VRRLPRRVRRVADPVRFPEARGPLEHWQRIPLNADVGAFLDTIGTRRLTCAEISGDTHAGRAWMEYRSLMHPEFDLLDPEEGVGEFDVVICEQVLEHVEDPWRAAENLRGLCVPGGWAIVSTPFLVRVHEEPLYGMKDYWRFTPRGLRVLLERAGLEVDEVRSWGNRDCVTGNFDRWPAFRWWHSLRDEPDLPVQVWAFARRPA